MVLFGLVTLTWRHVLSRPDGNLHLTLLDAEGTVLVQSPKGSTVLIGAGSRPSELNESLGLMLPAGQKRLDALLVGSTYRDDLNALTGALDRYQPELVLWNGDPEVNQTARQVYSQLREGEVTFYAMEAGQAMQIEEGLLLRVLWAGDRGAVFLAGVGEFQCAVGRRVRVEENWLDVSEAPDVVLLPDGVDGESLGMEDAHGVGGLLLFFSR